MYSFNIFFKNLSIIAVTLLILSILVDLFVTKITITPTYPFLLVFLYLVTLGIYKTLSKSLEKRLSKFANIYMLVIFGKLVFFTFIILAYAFIFREDAISFMLTFFIYYFIFTTIEIIYLLKNNT